LGWTFRFSKLPDDWHRQLFIPLKDFQTLSLSGHSKNRVFRTFGEGSPLLSARGRPRKGGRTWLLWPNLSHKSRGLTCTGNSCFCSLGRSVKNGRMPSSNFSGLPLSTFAPSRQSAQSGSRQYLRALAPPSIKVLVSSACSITGI